MSLAIIKRIAMLSLTIALSLTAAQQCLATVIYVDNRAGNDAFDGIIETTSGQNSGPVKTIAQGLNLAKPGDTIAIKNTGIPYYESFTLFGARHSGYQFEKFTIIGNGAVVDGSREVPEDAWKLVGRNLWKITPWRKGHYQLILDNQPVPMQAVPRDIQVLPEIKTGQWTAWRGSIYYRTRVDNEPPKMDFRFAHLGTGLTLYRVDHVLIRSLTFRHFRVDGINAPDHCHDVTIENVKSINNGRSGLFVGGSAGVVARQSEFVGSRQGQILLRHLGHVDLEQTKVSEEPKIIK